MSDYRLWVNEDGTVFVRLWEDGTLEVCTRNSQQAIWGPPIRMLEDKVSA